MVNSTADRVKLIGTGYRNCRESYQVLANYSIFVCRPDNRFCGYIFTRTQRSSGNDSLHTRRVWHISCNKDLFSESKMET